MSRRYIPGLLAVLLLAACGPGALVTDPSGAKVSPVPRGTGESPSLSRPVAGGTTVPVASPPLAAAFTALQRPVTPVTEVSGLVRLDAAYMVSKIRARVISNSGGSVVAVGPAELISDAGGMIVSHNSAGMVSKIRYQVAQTEPSAAPLAVGAVLPAAGMAITVHSLRTGLPMAIGVDAQGEPVYGVYSDSHGGFKLFLPAAELGNVLVSARVPDNVNAKLAYDLVIPLQESGERLIDEDTSSAALYLRQAFVSQFSKILAGDPAEVANKMAQIAGTAPELAKIMTSQMAVLRQEGDLVGVKDASSQDVYALAERATAIVLSRMDITSLMITSEISTIWAGRPPAPALATLVDQMRTLREGTRLKLAANPSFFLDRPFMLEVNACRTPGERYVIEKPSDISDLFIWEYASQLDDLRFRRMSEAWIDVVGRGDPATEIRPGQRMIGASEAILFAMIKIILSNQDGAKDEMISLIRAFKPGHPVPDGVVPAIMPPRACPLTDPLPLPWTADMGLAKP